MELRPGYKQSEVGVIPLEWEVRRLDAATEAQRPIAYGIVQTGPNLHGGVPCLRVVDIHEREIRKAGLIRTSKSISDSYRRTILKAGDLVMPLRGKVGDIGIVGADLEGANLTRGVALLAIRKELSGPFCKHFISWSATRKRLERSMNGSALQEIPIAALRRFEIAVPGSEVEQSAIAEALSDVDALLGVLDQFIAKKRDLKQAAMQQLLTGQTRLLGFHGKWEETSLSAVASLYQPQTISAKQFTESGFPVYGANGVVGYYHSANHSTWQVTVTCRGSTCGTVNKTVERCWITGNAMVLNCDHNEKLNKEFFYYLMLGQDLSGCITGTGQPQIVRGPLAEFQIRLPPDLPEQTVIAAVLTDMDAELATLEQRREKTRAIKQGMMQELLTGQIRLPLPETLKKASTP